MKEQVAFRIATGVVLPAVALGGSAAAEVQTGPGWEIPAAATNWIRFGRFSIVLYGAGIICYPVSVAQSF
jgi:hypothetical protein